MTLLLNMSKKVKQILSFQNQPFIYMAKSKLAGPLMRGYYSLLNIYLLGRYLTVKEPSVYDLGGSKVSWVSVSQSTSWGVGSRSWFHWSTIHPRRFILAGCLVHLESVWAFKDPKGNRSLGNNKRIWFKQFFRSFSYI
jgi:hypothetical protein